jgi:ATP-dependent helicase HrpB
LWEEAAHPGRPAFDPPEIETADLTPLMLSLARWGTADPTSLAWLDQTPAASIGAARDRLAKLGALDAEGRITKWGEQVASLPMDPVHSAMVLFGAKAGQAQDAARLALLLQERGLGGRGEDLLHRLSGWKGDRSPRAAASAKLADRWAERAKGLVPGDARGDLNPGLFLAHALPDNIAKRRDAAGESWISAGGRGYFLDPASLLARAEWLVIGDAQGQAKGARITAAAPLTAQEVEEHLADLIEKRSVLNWNAVEQRVEARLERRLGAITLATGPDPAPDRDAVAQLLLAKAVEDLPGLLPASLMARAQHTGIAALSVQQLAASADLWLAPLLAGKWDLALSSGKLVEALLNQLDWDSRQKLDKLAPREFASPAGTHHPIDYAGADAPSVQLRV